MPWNNQSGGGGRPGGGGNRGPWGGGPAGNQPPDLEELLKRSQEKLRTVLPGNLGGRGGALIAALAVAVVWLFSGIYFVQPDEQGVVTRFGAFDRTTAPGMNYHLPWPIERAYTPQVTRERQLNVGYRPDGPPHLRDIPQESLMLTGDENIIDINFTVFWVISDAPAFLFNVQNPAAIPDNTVMTVAESAMREVVGRNLIENVMTENRELIQDEVRALMQQVLDGYSAGITVTRIQMQKADPPQQVIASYRDVQAARTDQERMRNEAEAYANRIIPEARGEAARIIEQAEGFRQQTVAEAEGEAHRFLAVYQEFERSPDVTRRRIYLETMQQILAGMNKVIVDNRQGQGVVPVLPLPGLIQQPAAPAAGVGAPATGAGAAAGAARPGPAMGTVGVVGGQQ